MFVPFFKKINTPLSQLKLYSLKDSKRPKITLNHTELPLKPLILQPCLLAVLSSTLFACSALPDNQTFQKQTHTITPATATASNDDTNAYDASAFAEHPNRHEFTLDNGLKIIIKEDHRAPVVMTQIWYNVGATDEPAGKGGISHLLEHMMFKGTHKVSGTDFNRLITKFGGNHNAFTSYDYTGYYEMFPVNRLSLALELEADRVTNLAFDSAEFQTEFTQEQQVVMEERRLRTDSNPLSRSYEKFRLLALPNSPKGRSVIGPMQDIANITIKDLKDWYNQWYAPNNATLVIVGDVDPENTLVQVKKYFGDIKPKPIAKRPDVTHSHHQGYQQLNLQENVNIPTLFMAFNVPTLPSLINQNTTSEKSALKGDTTSEAYDLLMLQFVLDGGFAARFERSLIREQGLLSSIGSSYNAYERGDGLFVIQATPREGVSLKQAKIAILAEIDKIKNATISEQELKRAHNAIITDLVFSQDSVAGQAQLIGNLQSSGLDDRIINLIPNKIKQVSTHDINRIAQKYLDKDNLSVMYIEPKTAM